MEIVNIHTGEEFSYNLPYNLTLLPLNNHDAEYRNILLQILYEGVWKQNRTGIKTLSLFGSSFRFRNIEEEFPLITTKKVHWKSVLGELLWFLSGNTDKNVLKEKYGVSIWDEWEAPNPKFPGDMGPIYGKQWVSWEGKDGKIINQIEGIIKSLKTNPDDRRMIVSAWNPGEIHQMALPPCHRSFQFGTIQYPDKERRTLHLLVDIRSWDTFLGAPFNIASYATLLKMVSKETNMIAGDLIINAGDLHIYENHLPYIMEQLIRPSKSESPNLKISDSFNFWVPKPEDFILEGYEAFPNFKDVPIAV